MSEASTHDTLIKLNYCRSKTKMHNVRQKVDQRLANLVCRTWPLTKTET